MAVALTTPVINSLTPFDATANYTLAFFTSGGDQVTKNELVIQRADNNSQVYSQAQERYQFQHIIAANSLINGINYRFTLRTGNASGGWSSYSPAVLCTPLSPPAIAITNVQNGKVNNQSYIFTGSYSQSQGEILQSYRFLLYNSNRVVVASSDQMLDGQLKYQFNLLQNNASYYVAMEVTTVRGITAISPLVPFVVEYSQPILATSLNLANVPNQASVSIGAFMVRLKFDVVSGFISFQDGEWVDLTNGTIKCSEGFHLNQDFIIRLWVKTTETAKVVKNTLSSLPLGSLVKDTATTYNGVPIIWRVIDNNHSGYPSGSTTLITDKVISIKGFDGEEGDNPISDRKYYGNSRYLHSNLRQWLNSTGAANSWYSAQHEYDKPPTSANLFMSDRYDTEKGFLAYFSANFRNKLMQTSLIVALNPYTDGGGFETTIDKIFLASRTEVGYSNENNIAEGTKFIYFNDDYSNLIAYPTPQAATGINPSDPCYWWLRTPHEPSTCWVVTTSGAPKEITGESADEGNGIRPLCNLPSNTVVSNTADPTDNAYTINWSGL